MAWELSVLPKNYVIFSYGYIDKKRGNNVYEESFRDFDLPKTKYEERMEDCFYQYISDWSALACPDDASGYTQS